MARDLEKNMAEFLERWAPLRRYRKPVSDELGNMARPAIHMSCAHCESEQTFINLGSQSRDGSRSELYEWVDDPFDVMLAKYLCAGCQEFGRLFVLESGKADGKRFIRKIGQKPDWEVTLDTQLAKVLGTRESLFRRGVDCESSSYGVGAFAYYRRVVEEILDDLLAMIPPLLDGEAKVKYVTALQRITGTTVAQDKIALVKDLLPASLRRGGINPLDVLHDALSKGLHAKTDEECLDSAGAAREALVYLGVELTHADEAQKQFTDGMRRLLEKRGQTKR